MSPRRWRCSSRSEGWATPRCSLPKNSVGARALKKNAVTTEKLAANAVTGAKVKAASLDGSDINVAKLATVPSATTARIIERITYKSATATVPAPGQGSPRMGSRPRRAIRARA